MLEFIFFSQSSCVNLHLLFGDITNCDLLTLLSLQLHGNKPARNSGHWSFSLLQVRTVKLWLWRMSIEELWLQHAGPVLSTIPQRNPTTPFPFSPHCHILLFSSKREAYDVSVNPHTSYSVVLPSCLLWKKKAFFQFLYLLTPFFILP